jgi:hypothetical protein
MTAMNWALREDRVVLVTDSLSLYGDGSGRENTYRTKVFPLPHLRAVMCGTGLFQLVLDWFCAIQLNFVANDLEWLCEYAAPQTLQGLAAKYGDYGSSTTAYHFGLNRTGDKMIGFAHRSEHGFACERLGYGNALKPGTDGLLQTFQRLEQQHGTAVALVGVMGEQKADDDSQEPSRRIGIGGEVHFMELTANQQSCWTCYRFDDYDETYQRMLKHIQRPVPASE